MMGLLAGTSEPRRAPGYESSGVGGVGEGAAGRSWREAERSGLGWGYNRLSVLTRT